MEQEQTKPKGNRWLKEIKDWTLSLGIAIVVALLFQNYVYAQTEVHNISMQNTLVEGQRLIEDKWSYRFNDPKQGDIVIINGPEHEEGRLVKRIIALPGQTIDMRDGYVYVDGVQLDEPYAKGLTYPNFVQIPFTVPEGHVFVMGDNREWSKDSREFGAVSMESLEGKAVYRIWPLGKFGGLQ